MNQQDPTLSNSEIMLLQIIEEKISISGYELNKLVEERSIREWMEIGTTSIYVSLKKLEKKEFVTFYIDNSKSGKGPPPKKYSISSKGKTILKEEILKALSTSVESDKRFDLAFSGVNLLPRVVVILAIEKRIEFLAETYKRIELNMVEQDFGKMMFPEKIIYEHRIFSIKNEIEFMQSLLVKFKDNSIDA